MKLQQKLISRYSCLSGELFDKVLNIKSYYAFGEIEVTGVNRRKETQLTITIKDIIAFYCCNSPLLHYQHHTVLTSNIAHDLHTIV